MDALRVPPVSASTPIRLDEARQRLAAKYQAFARMLAKPYKSMAPRYADDFEGEAYLALVQCARTYDDSRKVPFPAFARYRIKGSLVKKLQRVMREIEDSDPIEVDQAHGRESDDVSRIDFENTIANAASKLLLNPIETDCLKRMFIDGDPISEVTLATGMSRFRLNALRETAIEMLRSGEFRREWIA